MSVLIQVPAHILDILISKHVICFSTSSRAEATPTRTTSSSGPTEVRFDSAMAYLPTLCSPYTTGPGGSSSSGLFMELGPCRVLDANGTKFHPESWNSNANIFFIDQPIGVGFSYAEHGETVSTTEEAAKDIAIFVAIFFEHFTQFQGRAFHMAGESYGGRYIPLFASAVYDQNVRLIEEGMSPINLTSIMIGMRCHILHVKGKC